MKKMYSVLLASAIILSLITGCGNTSQTGTPKTPENTQENTDPAPEQITYRYAELAETNHPLTEDAHFFADRVSELSGGRINIEIYDNAQLGAEKEAVQGTQMGSIDFVRATTTLLADFNLPMLNVMGLPYIFQNREHCWNVLSGDIGKEVLSYISEQDTGLVGLWFAEEGQRNMILVDGPVSKLSEIQGRKIRVNNAGLMIDAINAMGASAVPMAYTEVYSSLQSGVIEGLENIASGYNSAAHYEVAPYYTMSRHITLVDVVCVNENVWNGMSEEDRQIILQAAADTQVFAKENAEKAENAAMEELTGKGVTITEVDNPQEWRDALQPVIEKYGAGYEDIISQISALA